jgi:cytochrome b subunit of formate dehydrogenase
VRAAAHPGSAATATSLPFRVPRRSLGAVLPWLLLAALVLHGGVAPTAAANEECLDCHSGEDAVTGEGDRPLRVDPAVWENSVHGAFDCVDCHAGADEIPHEDALLPVDLDTCAECHADEVEAFGEGVHVEVHGGPSPAACADCHGETHAALSHSDPDSSAHWTNLSRACAHCHASREVVEKFGIPVVQPVEAYLEGVHGRAVSAGERAAVCSDCHGSHAILPSSDPRSKTAPKRVSETCGACHAEIAEQYGDSVHGVAAARGVRHAPLCTDCHGEHRILAHGDATSPVFTSNLPAQTCGRCHADTRLSARFGFSEAAVPAFADSFHGLALRAGKLNVANCASCHGVHSILPESDPRSLVHPSNIAETCGRCHPGAGTRFAIGTVHVSPDAPSSRLEAWIRFAYFWLIVGVVGFMVAHNGIDLVHKARHWPPPPRPAPPPRERMSRALRWQHGLVMLSFPVLVYTGFALTYPESWWAAPLLNWESRLGLRGLLHRGAAVVLLVGLAWHVAQICASPKLRAALRGLWPARSDFRYFGARMLHYAGRRRRLPPAGSFSYIEKLEYWAFLWGMVIMTVTGVPLWFSDVSLRYLPKWLTDVATAVHFYEAVLATLAIAVWHLYWTIFDPEVYPMDWSWWNGKEPANRTHEREDPEEP